MKKPKLKKVLMLIYSYYPHDPRPKREVETLYNSGMQVDMICLMDSGQPKKETIFGANVYRVKLQRSRSSKFKYIQLYLSFCIRSFFVLNWMALKNRYDIIHVHNMPDFLVFLTIFPKIFGTKIILDMHDPSPELLMTIFNYDENKLFTKLIKWIEKRSLHFAHLIITTNKAFVNKFISRGCPPEKLNIVMNSPQTSVFTKYQNYVKSESEEKEFILMYHGIIVERHGLDVLAKALQMIKNKIPKLRLIVCGYGEYESRFLEIVNELDLNDVLDFHGAVPIDEIAKTIPIIDLGIIPNNMTPFTNINFPTRIFEYLYFHKPVIVPKTEGIKDYFDDSSIFFFEAENYESLALKILSVYNDHENAKKITEKGYEVFKKYNWEEESKNLIKITNDLIDK